MGGVAVTAVVTRVSVVVPTMGREGFLGEALRSIRALEGPDLELDPIVIDDGDEIGTEAVAARYAARYTRSTSRGAAAARNTGLGLASGEFIAFLDDDDRWLPGHLRPHIRVLRQRPELGAVFGQVVSYARGFTEHSEPWPDPFPAGRTAFAKVLAYQPQIGATLVRRSALNSVGLFDEGLVGDEDWDWHLRLTLAQPVEFIPVPSVAYRCRPDGEPASDELNWERFPYSDRAFWQNVRRAGRARPRWMAIARRYLGLRGHIASTFLNSALAHSMAGDAVGAKLQLMRGFRVSPMHTLVWLVGHASARQMVLRTVRPGMARLSQRRIPGQEPAPTGESSGKWFT